MNWLHTTTVIFHVLLAAAIVALVLLQRGKGADAGAGFGAGASGTVFGARGSANFLSRTTAALAAAFFVTSLTLAFFGMQEREVARGVVEQMLAPGAGTGSETRVGPSSDDIDAPPQLPAAPTESELPPIEPGAG